MKDNIRNVNQVAQSVVKHLEKPVFESAKFYRGQRPNLHNDENEDGYRYNTAVQEHIEDINPGKSFETAITHF